MTIFIEHFVYRKVYIHFIDKFEIVISIFFMIKLRIENVLSIKNLSIKKMN